MKKRISLFLVFAMLITLIVPFTITTVSADTPTEITTKEELAAMSPSGNYVLANDVTYSSSRRSMFTLETSIAGFCGR